jgi:hypothetical protein
MQESKIILTPSPQANGAIKNRYQLEIKKPLLAERLLYFELTRLVD